MIKNISRDKGDLEFGDLAENLMKVKEGNARIVKPDELIVEEKPIPSNWNT